MSASAQVELDKGTHALALHRASTQCELFGVGKYQVFHQTSGYFLATTKANLPFGVRSGGSACLRHQRLLSIHIWHPGFQWHITVAIVLQRFHLRLDKEHIFHGIKVLGI